jgi:branched-chain amino acid transport system substrate-binding protein
MKTREETMAKRYVLLGAAMLVSLAGVMPAANAAGELRLGFLSTLSGPLGITGQEQKRGLELALEHLGGKIGGLPVQVFEADDKFNPAEAVQQAEKLIERDRVNVLTGILVSNVLLAIAPRTQASGTILISANAGGSDALAGKACQSNLFVMSFESGQWSRGIANYLNEKGVKRAYFLGLDYQAGWDMTKAVIKNFKGQAVAEVYTPPAQLDFSAELTAIRAANPDVVYAFYGGGNAIAFVKQYAQAGLKNIPLIAGANLSDPLMFEAQGDAAKGVILASAYSVNVDNPANMKFVEAFRSKYSRDPTYYAAMQYDAIMLLDAAIKANDGSLDSATLRAQMKKANFQSLRGKLRFNTNQYPIQDIYLEEVVQNPNGRLGTRFLTTALKDDSDPNAKDCPTK